MTPLVLDASAGVEFLLDTDDGRSLEAKLPHRDAWWVPEHYFLEVTATLRSMELHRGLAQTEAGRAVARLGTDRLYRAPLRRLLHDAWAKRGHMTIADALYVVLARELGPSW